MTKPTIGQSNWGQALNDHLDTLQAKTSLEADVSARLGTGGALDIALNSSIAATAAPRGTLAPGRGVAPNGLTLTGKDETGTAYTFPTITVSAANAASSLTGPINYPAATWDGTATVDTAHFTYSDSPPVHNYFVPSGLGQYRNGVSSAYSVSGITDGSITAHIGFTGQNIELLLPGRGLKYRLIIDGAIDPAGWRTQPNDGQLYRIKLAFSEYASRKISVQLPEGAFMGATVESAGIVWKAEKPPLPLCIVQGDSITFGQNITATGTRLDTFPTWLGQILGWECWNEGEGGTGWDNPGTSTGYARPKDRLATRVIPYAPDIVLAAFGLNDQTSSGVTLAGVDTQIRSWRAALVAALPRVVPIVVGPLFTCDAATDAAAYNSMKLVHDQIQTTCAALGVPFIRTDDWQTGKYGTGGTANVLLAGDGIHPNVKGHRYYAERIARGVRAALGKSGLI